MGMITSPYLSGIYEPRNLLAIDQIKFASCVILIGVSSHIVSIILFVISALPLVSSLFFLLYHIKPDRYSHIKKYFFGFF